MSKQAQRGVWVTTGADRVLKTFVPTPDPADEAWRNLLDCVRGRAFYGYASELLS